MSEVYVHEPSTKGGAVLRTTLGDLQVELWATECPKACRNFCQLILEGYYNGTIFHRVIRDFIVQGGDKTGTGVGAESIYGKPYADEIHPRLKFRYRGLMGVASAGKGTKTNGSQFFITLGRAPSLDGKHTLFGRVKGDTVYNLIRLSEVQVDKLDRPLEPPRIIRAELTWDPFGDLEPRCTPLPPEVPKTAPEEHRRAPVHNKRVLSFAASDGENEEDDDRTKKDATGKSAHDLLNDPKLSRDVAYPSQQVAKPSKRRATAAKEETADPAGSRRGSGSRSEAAGSGSRKPAAMDGAPARGEASLEKSKTASARPKPQEPTDEPDSGSEDSTSGQEDDEEAGAMQQEKASKRQETIARLKRDIASLSSGVAPESNTNKKPLTALEELRKGYFTRGKAKFMKREEKRQKAVQVQDKIKSFAQRIRTAPSTMTDAGEEAKEAKEGQSAAEPDKEEGTFAAIWDEGEEESTADWLDGGGLKFHVSADKAFKMESMKARNNLEIFDPLLVKGNDEVLAEQRKKRSEQMRPMLRRKEPEKKWQKW